MPTRRVCAYVEGHLRCRRTGTGNPPVCEVHRVVLESEAAQPERPGYRLGQVIGRVLRGQKLTDKALHDGIEDLLDVLVRTPSPGRRKPPQMPKPEPNAPRDRPREPRTQPQHGPDPRVVLGFTPGQKVTAGQVKQRHRELARKHHPDHGGSLAKMQAINAAVDAIMATL